MSTQIELKKIRRDGGTQSRADIDKDIVAEYAERMREGAQFPPVVLFSDGKAYWLADGFHRVTAAADAELTAIAADVRQGTQRDAILHSVGVNANHGLRRTNDDKRRAVEVLLRDPEWRVWSDREIARTAAVDHKTVGRWRAELVQRGEIPQSFAPAAVAKFYSEPIETAAEYAPGISEDANVEAARQVAIQALELWPPEALKQRLENGESGDIGGVTYRLGKGEITDAKGTAHPVGANHVAVALVTNNGAGVYRFYADQLADWIDERAAFAAQPEVLNALYSLLCGASYMPYGSTEAAKFGLTWGKYAYSGVKLTAFGKATIEAHISSDPKLAEDHRMCLEMNRSGELGYVVKALAEIYKGQKKSGEWIFIDRTWSNDGLLDRAKVLSKNGYLASLKRPALGGGNSQHHFYSITEKGAALLGLPMLPTPPDLPENAYHSAARTFVAPDAEFTVKVGDSVKDKKSKKIGRIVKLGNWPEFEVQVPGQYWKQTWYETQVEVVHGESLGGLDPVALAELDLQTAEVWRKAEGLLYALKAWTSDETDNPYGMHSKDGAMEALAQLMRWAADTHSAKRLKLEMPEDLEALVAE